jgi:hypothetical protein
MTMATSKDLLLSILALDSYNQGYGRGIEHNATSIGNATKFTPTAINDTLWSSTGFYASAYTLSQAVGDMSAGSKIISYRGTNADGVGPALQDIAFGWITGAGVGFAQSALASQYYTAVTGNGINAGASANTVLTGHSLGGGMHASIHNAQTVVFKTLFGNIANDNDVPAMRLAA